MERNPKKCADSGLCVHYMGAKSIALATGVRLTEAPHGLEKGREIVSVCFMATYELDVAGQNATHAALF